MKFAKQSVLILLCAVCHLSQALPEPKAGLLSLTDRLFHRQTDPEPLDNLGNVDQRLIDLINHWHRITKLTANDMIQFNSEYFALEKAIREAISSPQPETWTSAQAQQVINYLYQPYEPDLKSAVNAAIANKQSISASSFKSIFYQHTKWVQGNQTGLNNRILSRIPGTASLKSSASSVIAKINADTASQVAAFS